MDLRLAPRPRIARMADFVASSILFRPLHSVASDQGRRLPFRYECCMFSEPLHNSKLRGLLSDLSRFLWLIWSPAGIGDL